MDNIKAIVALGLLGLYYLACEHGVETWKEWLGLVLATVVAVGVFCR